MNSIYPEYLQQLISEAQKLRNNPELNEERKDYILITDEWYQKLMAHPFISRKPGKTIQLLKESCKFRKSRKSKDKKTISMSLKRFKRMDGQPIMLEQREPNENQIFIFNESDEEGQIQQNREEILRPKTFNI